MLSHYKMGILLSAAEKPADIKSNQSLSGYCSFGTGGTADIICFPRSGEGLKEVVQVCRKHDINYFVLGGGTNVIFSDDGFGGAVISTKYLNRITFDGMFVTAEAGASTIKLSRLAAQNNLTGLEFCAGIPGSVGGAVYMNAGACGSSFSSAVQSVTAINNNYSAEQCGFSYRNSIFAENKDIILSCKMKLKNMDGAQVKKNMSLNLEKRKAAQPLNFPSCGSVFKNPEREAAGALIERAGLKNYAVGGAKISDKHANFIINTGGATTKDFIILKEYIKERVFKLFNIILQEEVKVIAEK